MMYGTTLPIRSVLSGALSLSIPACSGPGMSSGGAIVRSTAAITQAWVGGWVFREFLSRESGLSQNGRAILAVNVCTHNPCKCKHSKFSNVCIHQENGNESKAACFSCGSVVPKF